MDHHLRCQEFIVSASNVSLLFRCHTSMNSMSSLGGSSSPWLFISACSASALFQLSMLAHSASTLNLGSTPQRFAHMARRHAMGTIQTSSTSHITESLQRDSWALLTRWSVSEQTLMRPSSCVMLPGRGHPPDHHALETVQRNGCSEACDLDTSDVSSAPEGPIWAVSCDRHRPSGWQALQQA